jgi:hypothetical protein
LTKLPLAFFEVYVDLTYNDNNEMKISERSYTGFQKNLWNFYGHRNPRFIRKTSVEKRTGQQILMEIIAIEFKRT